MPLDTPVEWPDGARLVITTSVMYEEGGQDWPAASGGGFMAPLPGEYRDFLMETWYEYGAKVGVPRLLNLLDKHGIKSSFFTVGAACENTPELVREIHGRGHEVSGHGVAHTPQFDMSREKESEFIRRSAEIIEKTVGVRPYGWNCAGMRDSANTLELLVEHGYTYHIDEVADDIPYIRRVSGKPLVVVPYVMHINDLRTIRPGYNASDFPHIYKYEFDWLYEESARRPTMFTITAHPRVSGRPGMAKVLDEFFKYAKGHPGVTFMRKVDIANWWLEKYGKDGAKD